LSLKNDIDMIKEELTSEEKFFEKSVMTERFVKKYKYPLVSAVVAVVLLVGGNMVYEMNKESNAIAANEALAALQKDASDANSLTALQTLSPELHTAYLFSEALKNKDIESLENLKNSKVSPLKDLVSYELAQNKKDVNALTEYALQQDAIYKDLAQLQAAIFLINDGKTDKAHSKLQTIADTSPVANFAKALMHYGVQ